MKSLAADEEPKEERSKKDRYIKIWKYWAGFQ